VLEVIPHKLGIALFRSILDQVVSPHFARDAGVDGIIPEDSNVVGLAELDVLLIELLGRAEGIHEFPVLVGPNERAGEEDGVELDIVLSHELIILDGLVLPPVPPGLSLVGGDGDLPDRGVLPHLEHLVLVALQGDAGAPLEVA